MNQHNTGSESAGSGEPGLSGLGAKSHDAAEQLKHEIVDQAMHVRERAESVKEDTAERIRRVASQVRSAGETLRPNDSFAASLAERASQSMEGIARYVASADARSFVQDAEQLARRQPAAFFGGAFLLGLAAGRFLKSSGGGNVAQLGPEGARSSQPARQQPAGGAAAAQPLGGEPVSRHASGARLKANYDATFGRDADALREDTRAAAAAAAPGTLPQGGERVGNGGRGKAVTP